MTEELILVVEELRILSLELCISLAQLLNSVGELCVLDIEHVPVLLVLRARNVASKSHIVNSLSCIDIHFWLSLGGLASWPTECD